MKVELVIDHIAIQNPDLSSRVDGNNKSLVKHSLVRFLNNSSHLGGHRYSLG